MRSLFHGYVRRFSILLAVLTVLLVPAKYTQAQYTGGRPEGPARTEYGKKEPKRTAKRGRSFFARPAKSNPADQLAYANELLASGSKRAAKQFRALVLDWPDSDEAPLAQRTYAQLVEQRGKLQKAFDEYQYLVDRYAGQFDDYDGVLESQFRIATELFETRKGGFFFFPGFKAPERAIPLLERIIENGPRWESAAEAQYLIGQAYEFNQKYEKAIVEYTAGQNRYPESDFAEKCAYKRAYCLYLIAEEQPNSNEALKEAFAAMTLFTRSYASSERVERAEAYRKTLLRRMAKNAYQQAVFYEKVTRRPKAALLAYRRFVKEFPNSEWTGIAEIRIDALSQIVDKTPVVDEDEGEDEGPEANENPHEE